MTFDPAKLTLKERAAAADYYIRNDYYKGNKFHDFNTNMILEAIEKIVDESNFKAPDFWPKRPGGIDVMKGDTVMFIDNGENWCTGRVSEIGNNRKRDEHYIVVDFPSDTVDYDGDYFLDKKTIHAGSSDWAAGSRFRIIDEASGEIYKGEETPIVYHGISRNKYYLRSLENEVGPLGESEIERAEAVLNYLEKENAINETDFFDLRVKINESRMG